MAESVFRGGISFLEHVGVYDVVLPFLLVFTLVFALLEKTKILGIQKDPNDEKGPAYAKRNLNSMVALVIAFFVVASSKLVELINKTVSQIFILLLLAVMFLLVAGTFSKDEEFFLKKEWQTGAMIVMGIAILLIFFNTLGWITLIYEFLRDHWSSEAVSALILFAIVLVFILYVTSKNPTPNSKKES